MNLVTRCTSCGTLFKVVADQLKISDGWVRCGQCANVFDAQANLVESPDSANTPPKQESGLPEQSIASRTTLPAQPDAPSSQDAASEPDSKADIDADYDITSEIESFRANKLQNSTLGAFANIPASPWEESESPRSDVKGAVVSRSEDPTTFFPVSVRDESLLPEPISGLNATKHPEADETLDTALPSFVVQAQRAERWRSPWVRFALCLIALALLAGLGLQVALHDKDRIATQWPQSKPWLEQLCQHVGCQVQAMKQIESIVVDASSFNRINKNNAQSEAVAQSYRLGVTLKNTGQLSVALPYIELSLQDTQDQTILRRVLSPTDLGSSLKTLSPAQDMVGSVTMQIDTAQLAGNRINGYRVLAFYP